MALHVVQLCQRHNWLISPYVQTVVIRVMRLCLQVSAQAAATKGCFSSP